MDGEPGQEIVANNAELSFSGLKQEVVASEVEIRFFNARKRNRRLSDRSFRARERRRRQRTPGRAIVQQEWAGHPVSGEFNVGRRAATDADPLVWAPAAESALVGLSDVHAEAEYGNGDRREREREGPDDRHPLR